MRLLCEEPPRGQCDTSTLVDPTAKRARQQQLHDQPERLFLFRLARLHKKKKNLKLVRELKTVGNFVYMTRLGRITLQKKKEKKKTRDKRRRTKRCLLYSWVATRHTVKSLALATLSSLRVLFHNDR